MSNRPSAAADLKPLTSLRFVAAMMIVGLHLKVSFAWAVLAEVPGTAVQGVSFFFVLSGFILTHVYSARPFPGYWTFITARFARLWPVHFAALLFLLAFVRADSITLSSTGLFSRPVLMAMNLGLAQSWFPTFMQEFSYNSVSWSISTEMAFYLAFPLLLPKIRNHWGSCLILAAGLAASVVVLSALLRLPTNGGVEAITASSLLYSQPLARGLEFVTGMASYVFWNRFVRHRTIPVWAYTAIEAAALALVFAWSHRWFWIVFAHTAAWPGLMAWYGEAGSFWAFALVIIAFASAGGWIGRAISWRPFIWLGEISFSIYMFHQILIKVFALSMPGIASAWTFFPALIALSAVSFYSVERFGRRWLGGVIGPSKASMLEVTAGAAAGSIPPRVISAGMGSKSL